MADDRSERKQGRPQQKASSILADELRAQILGHGLTPGSFLPSEADLIAETGMGRATVREALRLLESEGLITIKRGAHGGIVVRSPDPGLVSRSIAPLLTLSQEPLRNLLVFRTLLEPSAARLAAEGASIEQRASLVALAAHAPEPGYLNEVAFHSLLAECSSNELLRVVLGVGNDLLSLHHLGGDEVPEEDVELANRAHFAIAEAIAEGDGERAERAMLRHLQSFGETMEKLGRLDEPIVARHRWLADPSEWSGGSRRE